MMFRRFTAITIALIFTVVSGAASAQGSPGLEVGDQFGLNGLPAATSADLGKVTGALPLVQSSPAAGGTEALSEIVPEAGEERPGRPANAPTAGTGPDNLPNQVLEELSTSSLSTVTSFGPVFVQVPGDLLATPIIVVPPPQLPDLDLD